MKMALNTEDPKVEEPKTNTEDLKTTDSKSEDKAEESVADSKAEEPKEDQKEKQKEDQAQDPNAEETEKLKGEIKELRKTAKECESLTKRVEELSAEAEAHKSTIADYEALLTNIIESKQEAIPSDLKELIPDHLNLVEKLTWLEKAEKKGLFNKQVKKSAVEVGKPLNVETPKIDTAKLNAGELFKLAYNTVKK